MQITGSLDTDDGGDTLTPFLTPQHTANPCIVANSQESLDIYHDACATLQRFRLNSLGHAGRKRHNSLGTSDHAARHDLTPLHNAVNGHVQNGTPEGGRVRHASCSQPRPPSVPCASPPYSLGRLSLSATSLRRKPEQLQRRMASLSKVCELPPSTCLALTEEKAELDVNTSLTTEVKNGLGEARNFTREARDIGQDTRDGRVPCKADNDAWRRNYVAAAETERMLGGEVQLVPGTLQQPEDTVVQMYTFGPVQRRRVGLQRVREEFRRENLRLDHSSPHLFVSSQWQQHNRMSCLYLGYRLFWCLYFVMWAVWAWIGSMGYDAPLNMKGYYLLYMTNWGVWTLALDTTIQAVNAVLHLKKMAEDGDATYPSMTLLMRVSWVLSNITGAMHLFITSAYWITVYPNRCDEELNEIGVNTHIMPGLYILLDTAVSATPRRLLHAYHPVLFLAVYTLFNLTYYLCGGLDYKGRPALYPVLDWTKPGATVCIMGVVILGLMPFLHAIVCALYAARVKLWRILKISRYVREEDETEQVEQNQEEKV